MLVPTKLMWCHLTVWHDMQGGKILRPGRLHVLLGQVHHVRDGPLGWVQHLLMGQGKRRRQGRQSMRGWQCRAVQCSGVERQPARQPFLQCLRVTVDVVAGTLTSAYTSSVPGLSGFGVPPTINTCVRISYRCKHCIVT